MTPFHHHHWALCYRGGMTATIGLQLYTIRESLSEDVHRALARVAEIGIGSIELYGMSEHADAYERAIADTGLSVSSAHASMIGNDPSTTPDLSEALDLAERLGVRTLIDPMTPAANWGDADEIARMAEVLNAAAETAAARGIRVGYHNHDGEIRGRVGDESGLEHFVSLLDPRVVLEIDAYWVAAGGDDVVALATSHADRVRYLHVKDGTLEGDVAGQPAAGTGEPEHLDGQVTPGTGVVPLDATLAALPDLEFAVIEYDRVDGDIFAAITASRDYLIERGYIS
jgi:sugar phosphate isomerase/epimerase